jgi:hypothetical protein
MKSEAMLIYIVLITDKDKGEGDGELMTVPGSPMTVDCRPQLITDNDMLVIVSMTSGVNENK